MCLRVTNSGFSGMKIHFMLTIDFKKVANRSNPKCKSLQSHIDIPPINRKYTTDGFNSGAILKITIFLRFFKKTKWNH